MPAVPRLSKLLKPPFLQGLLAGALAQAEPGVFAVVVESGGQALAAAGPLPPGLDPARPGSDAPSLPLRVQGQELGWLVLGHSAAASDVNLADLGRFLARLLSDMAGQEATRRALGEEVLELYREAALTNRAVRNLNVSLRLPDVAAALLAECQEGFAPAECGMIFLKAPGAARFECCDAYGALPRKRLEPLAESDLFADILSRSQGEIVNDLAQDPRWSGEAPEITSLMLLPLRAGGRAMGALALAETRGARPFRSVHLKRLRTLCAVAGVAMSNAILFGQVQEVLTALMQTMATAIDSRDRCTAGHSHRVARLAQGLLHFAAQQPRDEGGFTEADLQEIYYAGLLHDVGKIGVREEVLTKATRLPAARLELIGLRLALWGSLENQGWEQAFADLERINQAYDLAEADVALIQAAAARSVQAAGRSMPLLAPGELNCLLARRGNLTPEEWEEIRRHPAESHRILKNIPLSSFFPHLLEMILQHHERLDGSGYPRGLDAPAIIPQSRVLAIADVYDALRRDRHYKKALPQDQALKILREEARLGKLDQRLVDIFCRHIAAIEKTVDLDTGLPACELVQ